MSKNFPGYVINSTTIAIDYWLKNDQITHYFLTHAHTDHTKGLDHTWAGPMIFCSLITKKLIIEMLNVQTEHIIALEMDQTHIMKLNADETFNVTLVDANHCPGAVMYLFEGYFGTILSTGDFRYSPNMFIDTPLKEKKIDICYLDNTYFNPNFDNIPSRKEALQEIIQLIEARRKNNSNLLIAIVMKNLGKEDLLIELSKHFQTKIHISETRFNRYTNVLNLDESYFTTVLTADTVICTEDNNTNINNISKDRELLRIKPTALEYSSVDRNKNLKINLTTYNVPFTDHSSHNELIEFIKQLHPKRVIPIVLQLNEKTDNTDISKLAKYLNQEPLIDSSNIFKKVLESRTSVRHSYNFRSTKELNKTPEESYKLRPRNRVSDMLLYQNRYRSNRSSKNSSRTEIEYESSPEKKSNKREQRQLRSSIKSHFNIDTNVDKQLIEISNKPETTARLDYNENEKSTLIGQTCSNFTNTPKNSNNKKQNSKDTNELSDINKSIYSFQTITDHEICSSNIDSKKSKWKKLNEQVEILESFVIDESFNNNLKKRSILDKQSILNDADDENETEKSIDTVENTLYVDKRKSSSRESILFKNNLDLTNGNNKSNVSLLDLSISVTVNDNSIMMTDNRENVDSKTGSDQINKEEAVVSSDIQDTLNPAESANESKTFLNALTVRLKSSCENTNQIDLSEKMLKFLVNSFKY